MIWEDRVNLKIGNNFLIREDKIKYLGVTLDEKLLWKEHLMQLRAKLRKLNFLFFHLKNFFREKYLKKLYHPLYESVMTYGIIHWGASNHIQPIKMVQNRVCRSILSLAPQTSESTIYPGMGAMELNNIYKYRMRMFMFKNPDLFRFRCTRQDVARLALLPSWWKEHSRMQGGYQGPGLFNTLPANVRNEKRLSVYKQHVRALSEVIGVKQD